MNETLTTYTVKSRRKPVVLEFKYNLDGLMTSFKILDEPLNEQMQVWLFHPKRFPYNENMMKSFKAIKNLEVIVGVPDLSFDAFYNLYSNKVGRLEAERAWNRMSKSDQIKAIKQIAAYDGYLKRKHIAKANPATYLNKRRYDDHFGSIH